MEYPLLIVESLLVRCGEESLVLAAVQGAHYVCGSHHVEIVVKRVYSAHLGGGWCILRITLPRRRVGKPGLVVVAVQGAPHIYLLGVGFAVKGSCGDGSMQKKRER
jgi:hypothetical protein